MKVIKPTPITAAMLISTNAAETYAAWNGATAYVVGNIVLLTSTQRLYERLVAGTTATSPELDPTNWLDIAPSNKWAMFDNVVSTQTERASNLNVVIKPGLANSIALFGLSGQSITVVERDALAGSIVYTSTTNLDSSVVYDWYMYFFEPNVQISELVITDLPPYRDAHITVDLTSSSTAKIGIASIGTFYSLGRTQYGASIANIDYSRKETDEFGVTSFVRRAYSKRLSAQLRLNNGQINNIHNILSELRATPCPWVSVEDDSQYSALSIFGFYKDFSIEIQYFDESLCNLEVEGLV